MLPSALHVAVAALSIFTLCDAARVKTIDRIGEIDHDAGDATAKVGTELRTLQLKKLSFEPLFQCPAGDTAVEGCLSICRHLELTQNDVNGVCPEFENTLISYGYRPRNTWNPLAWAYKKFRGGSSMDPVLDILKQNADDDQADFLVGALQSTLNKLPENKFQKYRQSLKDLQSRIAAYAEKNPRYKFAGQAKPAEEEEDEGTEPLPVCTGPIMPGDIATFEVGGPDFSVVSQFLHETAAEHEALVLRRHFSYGKHLEYGRHFKYEPFFQAPEDEAAHKRYAKKVANAFINLGKGATDVTINIAKGLADFTVNVGKGVGDVAVFGGQLVAKGFVYTGSGITAAYAGVRQTTTRTGEATRFTHSEIATGVNTLSQGQGDSAICSQGRLHRSLQTQIIISRFTGNGHTVPNATAQSHAQLAAHRAAMWDTYLDHHADTVGQWHRAVFGRCLNVMGNAGNPDYWKAVTEDKVQEMWDYEPTDEQNEAAFWRGVRWVHESFITHDANGRRVKPKAMFPSKFVSAVWSSVMGNPSEYPEADIRHADVNEMFPFNPGACSPWTLVKWMIGKKGSKYWHSCRIDSRTGEGDPCRHGTP